MAESGKVQFSLSGGEISPTSLGRSDIDRWQSSLAKMRNWIPLSSGSAMNRPGTEYLGHEYIKRSFTQQSFTATTSSSPMLVTATAHGLSDGDCVLLHTTVTSPYSIAGVESEIEVQDADHFWMLGYDSSSELASYVGTFYKVEASQRVRILPFEIGVNDAYGILFGNNHFLTSRNGELEYEEPLTVSTLFYPGQGHPLRVTLPVDHNWQDNDEVYISKFDTTFPQDHGERRYRISLDPVATPVVVAITSMTPQSVTQLVFAGAHGIGANDRIRFTSLRGPEVFPTLRGDGAVGFAGTRIFGVALQPPAVDRLLLVDIDTGEFVSTVGDSVNGLNLPLCQVGTIDRRTALLDNTGGNVVGTLAQSGPVTARKLIVNDSPYGSDELSDLRYARAQDGTTMSITCPGKTPRKLARSSVVTSDLRPQGDWGFTDIDFLPSIEPPSGILPASGGAGGTGTHWMKISSVQKETGEESIGAERYVATDASLDVTWTSVPGAFEYNVYISRLESNSIGLIQVTTAPSTVLNTSANQPLEDQSIRPPVYSNPFFVDGPPVRIYDFGNLIAMDAAPIRIPIKWASAALANTQHVFAVGDFCRIEGNDSPLDNQIFRISSANITGSGHQTTITLEHTDGALHGITNTPLSLGIGTVTGFVIPLIDSDYPKSVTYHQQRLVLGNTNARPQGIFATRTRSYNSMKTSTPPKDTDAILLEVVGDGVNAITHILSAGALLAFTAGGIFEIKGNSNGVLTPTATALGILGLGSSDVRPLIVGNAIVYITAEGPSVVELIKSDLTTDRGSFKQGDPPLSTLANHLLEGRTILESARGNAPDNVLWWTRDDGVLLGMTYVAAAEVVGWHRHDTLMGDFESVANIPSLPRTDTYFSIKRNLNNVTKRHFERFDQRDFIDVEDAVFLDSSTKFDDAHPVSTKQEKTINLEFFIAAGHPFLVGDEFDVTHRIRTAEGITNGLFHRRRLAVHSVGADSFVVRDLDNVIVNGALAFDEVDTRTLVIHRCVTSIEVSPHLAGVKVGLLLDGNEGVDQVVGRGGTLTFASKHSRIVVGLPIEADLETLPPDAPGGPFESTQGMQMRAHSAVLTINNTLGLKIGPRPDALQDIRWAKTIPLKYGSALELRSGRIHTNVSPEWGEGKIFLRQSSHLPAHILSIRTQFEVDE